MIALLSFIRKNLVQGKLRFCKLVFVLCFVSPMFVFLLSCFSFILVFKSSYVKPLLLWLTQIRVRLLSPIFWLELPKSLVSYINIRTSVFGVFEVGFVRPVNINHSNDDIVDFDNMGKLSFLDLPELALDSILDRLSPAELCSLGGVCTYLRAKCRSDHIWEKHMERKWGKVIGNVAYREWQWHMASNKRKYSLRGGKHGEIVSSIFSGWPLSLIRPKFEARRELKDCLPPDSIMARYLSLESGEFWFPAQVYNRENGHDGFVMSCYDAELSYNLKTDTFQARYSPRGRRTLEENISWSRLRAPPIDNSPYVLHVSDCLDDLKPGDHFEIQWRRNQGYRYGWWYGVVGHLEACSGNETNCICHDSDIVILEFNQYAPDSRWRRKVVDRKSHREEGNEADGFYGGIRKLYCQNEISTWQSLWPTKVLD